MVVFFSDQVIEKLVFSYPVMILFYFIINKSLDVSEFFILKIISLTIFFIQILFHTYQLVFAFECTPNVTTNVGIICNKIALIFGIVHFSILSYSYLIKRKNITLIGLCIAAYMILSHLITIHPYQLLRRIRV